MKKRPQVLFRAFKVILVFLFIFPLQANIPSRPKQNGSTRIYVDIDAAGLDNGISWTDAYTHLQDALDVVNTPPGSIDYQIWVAEGVYYPDEENHGTDHTDNDYYDSFEILYDNVQVYGGFAGTETFLGQRDWENNLTILSGDIDGDDTNTDGNYIAEYWHHINNDNALHVVSFNTAVNEDITDNTVLDGFVITAGKARISGTHSYGGGIFCFAGTVTPPPVCSPALRNLLIQGNRADLGGGIMLYTNDDGVSNPILNNVTFFGNFANNFGGGMYSYVANDPAGESTPALVNVKFHENLSNGDGGGMYIYAHQGTNGPTLTNVEFYDNTANGSGGGIYSFGSEGDISMIITNTTFSKNTADIGGAMYTRFVYSASYAFIMELYNTLLWDNTALTSNPEIFNDGTDPGFASSIIEGCGGSSSWSAACGTNLGGNLDTDPLFVNALSGDLSLQVTSPAVDAGDHTLLPPDFTDLDQDGITGETVPLDLAMIARVTNDDVDMGAFEHGYMGPGYDTIGMYRPDQKSWYLKDANNDGWSNVDTIRFGSKDTSWLPVRGDWNENEENTIGMYKPDQKSWYLKLVNNDGWANVQTIRFGSTDTSWVPVVGDWFGYGKDSIGFYSPPQRTWYLKYVNCDGWGSLRTVRFGSGDTCWVPVVGDWDGDGTDTIGMYSPSQKTWYLKDTNTEGWGGITTVRFGSTDTSWVPVVGDWDGDNTDTIGMYSPSQKTWYLKDTNTDGWGSISTVRFGSTVSSWSPVTGRW